MEGKKKKKNSPRGCSDTQVSHTWVIGFGVLLYIFFYLIFFLLPLLAGISPPVAIVGSFTMPREEHRQPDLEMNKCLGLWPLPRTPYNVTKLTSCRVSNPSYLSIVCTVCRCSACPLDQRSPRAEKEKYGLHGHLSGTSSTIRTMHLVVLGCISHDG